jgi:hypothetical protein
MVPDLATASASLTRTRARQNTLVLDDLALSVSQTVRWRDVFGVFAERGIRFVLQLAAVLPPTAGTRWGWWRIFARVGWTGPLSPVTRQDPLAPPRKTSAVPRKRHHRSFGKLFK